jgi:hypothetical protein
MSDKSTLSMLERLELMKGRDGERRPYSAKAQAEIDEGHASQVRIDAMGEAVTDDETSEDSEETPTALDEVIELLKDRITELVADNERLRQQNIALNGKLVATGGELLSLRRILGRFKLEHPEYFGGNDGQ